LSAPGGHDHNQGSNFLPRQSKENPRKTKEKSLHFLVFPWPNLDFSMGYSESK
jgi:hypothetical protein